MDDVKCANCQWYERTKQELDLCIWGQYNMPAFLWTNAEIEDPENYITCYTYRRRDNG